ncbi:MAG: PQQ-dependent sugar dehydrogenase, partial [Halobacteriota archaeon]
MAQKRARRRAFLRASLGATAAGVAGCLGLGGSGRTPTGDQQSTRSPTTSTDQTDETEPDELSLAVEPVVTGLTSPVDIAEPAGLDRRFVVDQIGVIHLHDEEGLRERPYLDLRERIVTPEGADERGLLGLAFHPDFGENGRLYVRYSAPTRSSTPAGYDHTFVLSEFTAEDATSNQVDVGSERTVLEIPEPQSNHNAGSVVFGPDGYLYVGVGDGGGANDSSDGHVGDWYDGVRGGNGQDVTENLLGSILRIDVDDREGGRGYGIPDGNPLVGSDGLDEQYAWGFRNPWRFSFSDEGDLYVADVGQNEYEEVNLVEKGGNYGWNVKEGTHCFRADSCPSETPDGEALVDPIIEYPHDAPGGPTGIAVIGGYRYDGDAIPALAGSYVFADWLSR